MEGPLKPAHPENSKERVQVSQHKSAHLMCGKRFWGISGAVACLYFADVAWSAVRDGDYSVSHDGWAILTYSVWIVLALGLISEARCWRERVFFGLVLLNLTLGFVLAAWTTVPVSDVRASRRIALGIWLLAALASLVTAFAGKTALLAESEKRKADAAGNQS